MVKLNNACLPCKQYSRPRMCSNRSPLVKCLTVSATKSCSELYLITYNRKFSTCAAKCATKSCSELYLITYNRKFSTCAARKESLDGALRHCNIHVRFSHTNLHEV